MAEQEEEEENDPSLQHNVGELLEPLKKMCFTKVSMHVGIGQSHRVYMLRVVDR